MVVVASSTSLYPDLLRERWWDLAEGVRQAHMPGTKRGSFAISHSSNPLARQFARWSRLPRAASNAATTLKIEERADGESWHRTFGDEAFNTRQRREDGWLVEEFAGWQLCFELCVEEGALRYVQKAARLCLGSFHLRMPLPLSPSVKAREYAEEEGRVRVEVAVSLPIIGPLITYRGLLEVG